jgi:hypothetical protein
MEGSMATWTPDDLSRFTNAEELDIASRRADGTLRPYVTIWFVRLDDDLYVRSAYGPQNGWYRRAVESGLGRIRISDAEQDVMFESADPSVAAALDRAYHQRYDRHGAAIVDTVVSADAARSTLRLAPR